MRSPSHLRSHVSRSLVLRAAVGAMLVVLALVPAAGAAKGDRGVFVSKGVGREIFTGGGSGGVTYGVVFSGGSLVVADYSPALDMHVDSPVIATTNPDGSKTYVPAGGAKRFAFRITGTLYRVTVQGSSTFNAAGIYGRLQLRGRGTLVVGGVRSHWGPPATVLGRVPKDLRKTFQYALTGAPPLPPVTVPPPPTTTTTTATG